MQGDLYKITNLINGKVYIGKTYIGYLNRWRQHKSDAFRKDKEINYKFYRALRKYGVENFNVELLGTYESEVLEKMEIEAINYYDSYYNGYNSTLGGEGSLKTEYNEKEIIDMYKSGVSINNIAREFGLVNTKIISKIIKEASNENLNTKTKAIIVEQYDKDWRLLRTFNSKQEAHNWLVENYKFNMKKCTSYYRIKKAIEDGGIAFGFHWKMAGEREVECSKKANKHYKVTGYKNGVAVLKDVTPAYAAKYVIEHDNVSSRRISNVIHSILQSNGNPKYGYTWNIEELD